MPLIYADIGQENIVHRVGGSQEVRKHLEDMGVHEGAKITLVAINGGNVIVNVKDTRIALDHTMASKIMI